MTAWIEESICWTRAIAARVACSAGPWAWPDEAIIAGIRGATNLKRVLIGTRSSIDALSLMKTNTEQERDAIEITQLHFFRHQNGRVNTLARLNERRVGPCALRFRWPIKFSAVSMRFIAHIAGGHSNAAKS